MKIIWHRISIQTLLFWACLPTHQNGFKNRDKAYSKGMAGGREGTGGGGGVVEHFGISKGKEVKNVNVTGVRVWIYSGITHRM